MDVDDDDDDDDSAMPVKRLEGAFETAKGGDSEAPSLQVG
jgi:hypothetical protein